MYTPFSGKSSLNSGSRGFTLVELVVSITILSVILISVFEAYSNIINVNKRLEILRSLQENARNMTETIANDVREKGIDFAYYDGSDPLKKSNSTGSGTSILAIRWGIKYYPMRSVLSGLVYCDENDMKNPSVHCFLGMENAVWSRVALTNDAVRVNGVRFFLSGDDKSTTTNLSSEWKATIVFSIESEKRSGLSSELAEHTKLQAQTTISEKIYKKN